MNYEEVSAFFTQRGIKFETKDLEYCRQLRVQTGEMVNFFKTG